MSQRECPYCNEEIDWEALPSLEEESAIIECEHCGKKFNATTYVTHLMTKDCAYNEEEHTFIHQPWIAPDFYECSKCGEFRKETK